MSSAAAAGIRAFGLDRGLPFPMQDIAAAEVVLLVGSNPAETMPPFMRFLDEQRRRGGRLIAVDPRATATARSATLHLAPAPGTDLALANGPLHILVRERMIDRAYIQKRTSGFGRVLQTVATYWPDRVERITGVPADDIRRAALTIGEAGTAMVLTGRGGGQHSKGTETVLAFINLALALALGLPGRRSCGYGCLTGQGNGQGGREHGQKADQLPGYRLIADPAARAHVAAVWGVDPDELVEDGARLGAREEVASAERAGQVHQRLGVAAHALRGVDRPTAPEHPALQVGHRAVLLGPLGRGEDHVGALGRLRRASAGGKADYAGITYERIAAEDGVFWPCPTEDHPGTPRMFLERSRPTTDARALSRSSIAPPARSPTATSRCT